MEKQFITDAKAYSASMDLQQLFNALNWFLKEAKKVCKVKMRLKESEILAIKNSFELVFPTGQIYLFGSRTDDTAKGGDIDLFIEIFDKNNLFEKKIKFLANLKKTIGEQKIDVVFNEDENRLIEKEIKKCRIKL